MANDVYLSSTLNDLVSERDAVLKVLAGQGFGVKQSYSASEQDLVSSCLDDVAQCRIYIGIVGDRYGYCPLDPARNPNGLSITELEFEQARAQELPCFVFVKDRAVIAVTMTDKDSGDNQAGQRIADLRHRLQSLPLVRTGRFADLADLREQVLTVVLKVKGKGQPGSIFESDDPHPGEMATDVALVVDALGLDSIDEDLARQVQADARFRLIVLDPSMPDYLARLDERCAKCCALAWHLSSRSLGLYRERGALLSAAMASQRQRRGAVGALLTGAAAGARLPGDWGFDVIARADDTLRQAFDELHRGLRPRVGALRFERPVGVPVIVLAMTQAEAATLAEPDQLWQGAAVDDDERRLRSAQLSARVAALRAHPAHARWPAAAYGDRRDDWRPFGAGLPSVNGYLQQAFDRINSAHSKRDRVFIRSDQIKLVPHAYSLDDLLRPAHGSDTLLRRVRDRGCLVLVDELSLLHPALRSAARVLLKGENVAVLSSHPFDPAAEPVSALLGTDSWLDVGILIPRFGDEQDPRCELAIGSPERLRRWLILVLPELVNTLGGGEAQRSLLERTHELLKPTSAGA